MKIKFKLKLNGNQLLALWNICRLIAALECTKPAGIEVLVTFDLMNRLGGRLLGMYRPDKDRYTVGLSPSEAKAIIDGIFTATTAAGDPYSDSVAWKVRDELERQIDRETSVFKCVVRPGQYVSKINTDGL